MFRFLSLATFAIFGFSLLAIVYATTNCRFFCRRRLRMLAIYMMINPAKASYSMAPTMVVCALAGFLTASLFVKTPQRHRILLTVLIGFLLGVAVDFRVANLFLSAGYFLFFLFAFLRARNLETFLEGGLFGVAFLVGIAPTLIANAINAGSPFATTYSESEAKTMDLDAGVIWSYCHRHSIPFVVNSGRMDRVDTAPASRERHTIARAGYGGKSGGEYGLLHDPPRSIPSTIRSPSPLFRCGACCLHR